MSRGLLFFYFVFLAFGSSAQGNSWYNCDSAAAHERWDVTNGGNPTAGAVDISCSSANQQYECCNNLVVKSCSSCSSGYTKTTRTVNIDGGGACNGHPFQVCVEDQLAECDNCGGECRGEHYVPVTGQPGYQSIFNETCYSLECKCQNMPTLKYKCAPGYRQVDEKVSCNPEGCSGCKKCSATDEAYGADGKKQCLPGDWGHYSEGYEYRDDAKFNSEDCSCEFTKEYRCAAGWYGLAFYNFLNRGMDGCSQCSTVGNIFMDKNLKEKARGTSTAGNNSKKDSCYLPTNTYYMKSGTVKIENTVSSMCTY